ncbi:MAG: DUF4388 domain-containing protein [Coleofasciculus sp. G1-WW12-02]|uniref:DUF4388 domain-containing protein n=1 Tax=Coleofasciculus sp. G1-WW12-02 TaxID=3068483 RepID=UPI0032F72AFE
MCITGSLADFSLPQVFWLLETGHQSGLLTLHPDDTEQTSSNKAYYIWVYRGNLVGMANLLDDQGLVSLITQRRWLKDTCPSSLFAKLSRLCPQHQPLGSYLKKQGILTNQQLKWLFQAQVLQPIYDAFKLKSGHFRFDHNVPLPTIEMTGLSISATLATLIGLRNLPSWDALADQLPDPDTALASVVNVKPDYPLNDLEWQVWTYTDCMVSLQSIAQYLQLPLKTVQQIAFRLIAIGLAEEIFLEVEDNFTPTVESPSSGLRQDSYRETVSYSFLQNLLGFLVPKAS